MNRPLIVSNRWVPAGTGTPFVLYELFRHFPEESCIVACGPGMYPETSMRLPFPTHRFSVAAFDGVWRRAYRSLGRAILPAVLAWLRRIARRERPSLVYAHYPDAVFVTAAAQLAGELGVPLVTYFDVPWDGNDEPGMARTYEGRVIRAASRRFAITEMYCEHLSRKHSVPVELLPHVIAVPAQRPAPARRGERRDCVHLGGSVYRNMNLDSVQRLHRVLARMSAPPCFEIYGFGDPAALRRDGIDGPFVTTGVVPRAELLALQRTADVLYLPEAFESGVPEMIRYNFPTRALDYMQTGTPILVHAPAGSYLARTAREHGWGLVVDSPDEQRLAEGLDRLRRDQVLAEHLSDAAWQFVQARDGRRWSGVLAEALGIA